MSNISYALLEIANLIGYKSVLPHPNIRIKYLLYDSRRLSETKESLFFVLPGRVDAHRFIPDLYLKGIRNFVIYTDNFDTSEYSDANFIYCHSSIKALQQLATAHRNKFNYPVIGITGSNGKTIVKEWLHQLLQDNYTIIKSPKSYNSQLGVPLSVWQMDSRHDLGIFESGISTVDEMYLLEKVIQPTIGILTNIGPSHDEGFTNTEEKIREKIKLFKNASITILEKKYITYLTVYKHFKTFTWSFTESSDLQILSCESKQKLTKITAVYLKEIFQLEIPFSDKAAIENAITCCCTLLYLGFKPDEIAAKMKRLQSVSMRLELKSGKNNCSIIDDSYNADLASLAIALDFLLQQQQHHKRTLILSDLYQTGIPLQSIHESVAQLLKIKHIHQFIGVGENLYAAQKYFPQGSIFFKNTEELLQSIANLHFENEAILIKGSRDFKFERISKLLTSKVHETVLEINLNAIEHNLNYYKAMLKPNVGIMAVVKAFSYGSGSFEIANLLQYNKIDYLAVAYADEGIALRSNGITLPIMVMSPEISSFQTLVDHNLEPEIYSLNILKSLIAYLPNNRPHPFFIHLKIDTGMHRLGFLENEIDELIAILNENPTVKVKSVFSHLVASDDVNFDDFTNIQIKLFNQITIKLEKALHYSFAKHLGNTNAIHRFPEAQFDWVRLGIGLYGLDADQIIREKLQPVLALKTSISQIKHLKKGDTVGYNRRGVMPHDGKIATIKIGYADGLSRKLGNGKGLVYINQQEAKTIGNICMDMCMVDVSFLEAYEGDEVIIFNTIAQIQSIAEKLETIPYEILTQISQRVKRVYYYQ